MNTIIVKIYLSVMLFTVATLLYSALVCMGAQGYPKKHGHLYEKYSSIFGFAAGMLLVELVVLVGSLIWTY